MGFVPYSLGFIGTRLPQRRHRRISGIDFLAPSFERAPSSAALVFN
jgi:hypothetical protein